MACFIRGPSPLERAAGPAVLRVRALARAAGPVVLGCLTWLGCAREAPGPAECVAFAEAWLKTHRPSHPLAAHQAFDDLVRHCLTEPYDRELVTCVVAGERPERCRVDYVRRVEAQREGRLR